MLRGDAGGFQPEYTSSPQQRQQQQQQQEQQQQEQDTQTWAGLLKRASAPLTPVDNAQCSFTSNANDFSASPSRTMSSAEQIDVANQNFQQPVSMNQHRSHEIDRGQQRHASQSQSLATPNYATSYLSMFSGLNSSVFSSAATTPSTSHAVPPPAFLPAPSTAAARLPAAVIHGADGPEKTSFRRWKWDAASLTSAPSASVSTGRAGRLHRPRKDVTAVAMDAFETETMLLASMPRFTDARPVAMAAAAAFRAVAPFLQIEDRTALQNIFVTKPPKDCLAAVVEVVNRASSASHLTSSVIGTSKNNSYHGQRPFSVDSGQYAMDSFGSPFLSSGGRHGSGTVSAAPNTGFGAPSLINAVPNFGLSSSTNPYSSAFSSGSASAMLSPARSSVMEESPFARRDAAQTDQALDETGDVRRSSGSMSTIAPVATALASPRDSWSQQQTGFYDVWNSFSSGPGLGTSPDDADGRSESQAGTSSFFGRQSPVRVSQGSSASRNALNGSPLDTVRWSSTIQQSVPSSSLDANAPCFTMTPKH